MRSRPRPAQPPLYSRSRPRPAQPPLYSMAVFEALSRRDGRRSACDLGCRADRLRPVGGAGLLPRRLVLVDRVAALLERLRQRDLKPRPWRRTQRSIAESAHADRLCASAALGFFLDV